MLDSLVPRLRAGVQVVPRADGSAVLVDAPAGIYVEIAADQAALVALMDGRRSTADLAADHYARFRFVPFQALGDLLATLRAWGLLDNTAAELDRAGVPKPTGAALTRRLASLRLLRLRLPGLSFVSFALEAGLVLLLAAAVLPLLFKAGGVGDPSAMSDDPLSPRGSPLLGLALAYLGASLALAVRSAVRASVAASFGAKPEALELRLHYAVLAPEIEGGALRLLTRGQRMLGFGASLLAPFATAAVCAALAGQGGVSLALGALIVGFIDACPIAPTSAGALLATVAGRVDLRDHARSYLSRRLLSRVGSQHFFEGEKAILVTSTLAALWSVAGVNVMVRTVPREALVLYASTDMLEGAQAAAAWVELLLLVAGSLVALVMMAQTVLAAVGSVVPRSVRGKPAAATETKPLHELGDGVASLKAVPLYAALSEEALAAVSREVTRVTYPAGATVVRQGDAGDRFYALLEGKVAVVREHDSGLEREVATLAPGDCFGEAALLAPVPRSATVRAKTPVVALALNREGFSRLVQALPGADLTRRIRAAAALNKNPLLNALAPERLSSLLPKLVPREVAPGVEVVRKGDAGDFFYVVGEGELEVIDDPGAPGAAPVATLSSGDHFGEVALLRDVPRIATVRARTNAVVWSLSKADFFALLGRDLSLSRSLEEEARTRVQEVR